MDTPNRRHNDFKARTPDPIFEKDLYQPNRMQVFSAAHRARDYQPRRGPLNPLMPLLAILAICGGAYGIVILIAKIL